MKVILIVQLWEEVEEGVHTAQAGYSLHLEEKDRPAFLKRYWESLPVESPETFCRPIADMVYRATVDVGVYNEVKATLYGKRYEGIPPEEIAHSAV